ncbi:MAG: ATP-binding protein, partial [Burkholderiaceae bacterium]
SWIKYQAKEINLAYRMATEGCNDGFYMLRPIRNKSGVVKDFEIADCNEKGATFFGKKSAQFINMRTSDIFPKACFSIVNGTLCNAMETGYLEHEIQKSPDSPLQLEWAQIRLVRSGNGLAVTMRDMTQSKEDEIIRMGDLVKERTAELAQSNYRLSLVNQAQQEHQSELTRFLAVASHDLRQPMHALNLYLGALQNVELNDTAQPLLANVTKCAQIMDKMFLALLDLSRLDAQLVKPHIEHFPIDTVLTRLAVEYAPQAQANGIAFHIDHSNEWVASDMTLVEQILLNLTANAVRYTPAGRVTIACTKQGDKVRVAVQDTGIGISPHHQQTVFEEFCQVGTGGRDRTKGLGLGLAIVKRLCSLLNIPIALVSELAQGSTFSIELPLAVRPTSQVAAPTAHAIDQSSLRHKLIVVVEDEESILDAMRTLLEQQGCAVITAMSGSEAIAKFGDSKEVPDALVCDYRLRINETGLDVIEKLRNEFNHPIPALLITGDTTVALMQETQSRGIALLHKPVQPEGLLEVLIQLIYADVPAA